MRGGHRQKVFDHREGMIRQGDRAQANYRRSETLPLPSGSSQECSEEFWIFKRSGRRRLIHEGRWREEGEKREGYSQFSEACAEHISSYSKFNVSH
jgi:hypothetical protein